jgi:uncharacterized protein
MTMHPSIRWLPARAADWGAAAEVALLPHRAIYWPAARTLLVADLHWGKCETFRAGGAPLPQGLLEADLQRLSNALRATESSRLIVIGDLLHTAIGITDWLVDTIAEWRERHAGIEILVAPGNHDRRIAAVADIWRLSIAGAVYEEGPFAFVHDPDDAAPAAGQYSWAGHLHPMITLRGRGDCIRLPCFWMGQAVGVLPAFSAFTDGMSIQPEPGDAVVAAAPDGIFAVQ